MTDTIHISHGHLHNSLVHSEKLPPMIIHIQAWKHTATFAISCTWFLVFYFYCNTAHKNHSFKYFWGRNLNYQLYWRKTCLILRKPKWKTYPHFHSWVLQSPPQPNGSSDLSTQSENPSQNWTCGMHWPLLQVNCSALGHASTHEKHTIYYVCFGCSKPVHDTNLKHCLEMFPSEHTTKINIHMETEVFWETMLCSLVISYRHFGRNLLPPS